MVITAIITAALIIGEAIIGVAMRATDMLNAATGRDTSIMAAVKGGAC
jgi:hypothetical protein